MKLVSSAPFVPHSYQHLVEVVSFPKNAMPEPVYAKLCRDYEAIDDVVVSRIIYESAGLKITGIMALPKSITAGNHPVLIFNRGGNGEYGKLTVSNVLRHMLPFARKGYLVFASNYRGNDGGEGRDEFGGGDVDDVAALLAIAKTHAGYDGKNAYMLGHSRGGMMTTMSIRGHAPVNAAISIAGVSDLRQSGIERPEMTTHVYHQRFPDTETEYEKRSALHWPGEIAAPLLLLHGDADEAVHVGHSQRLAAALAAHHKPHALHIYPGGNHALFRLWDDVLSRCFAWMEEYKQ